MNSIIIDAPISEEKKRELLYRGQLLVYSPTPSSLALVDFARKIVEAAFHPLDPETAQFHLPVEKYAAILSELKPKFIHAPESKKCIQGMLGDLGFVRADRDDERRVYDLTDAGRSELDAHADTVQYFWARFAGQAPPGRLQPEMGFVQDELNELTRTVWGGTRAAVVRGDDEAIRNVRSAIERCKNEVREIIARSVSATSSAAVDPC